MLERLHGTVPAIAGGMQPQDMRDRTKKFAVSIIRFAKAIPRHPIHDEIGSQLTDAACAVASGYRAVCRARSRADFIYKLGNAIEEGDESMLWLEILRESDISPEQQTQPLWREADEIVRILVRSRETARANREHTPRVTDRRSTISNRQRITNR